MWHLQLLYVGLGLQVHVHGIFLQRNSWCLPFNRPSELDCVRQELQHPVLDAQDPLHLLLTTLKVDLKRDHRGAWQPLLKL